MTNGNSFKCSKEDCDYKTSVRVEMVYHSVKKHGAVYSKKFIRQLQPRSKEHEKLRDELLELSNE